MPDTNTRTASTASATPSSQVDAYTQALIDRAHRFEDDVNPYRRGLIATRIYRDRPDLPTVLKRAEILAQTLEQLPAAQDDPARYRYLMVRVFGLSAQFANLAPELQETVIERVAAASQRL